ncbi:hypothetical protein MBAV_002100 [Candidatus Magnetobacterium bavaricum]|uniref:Uncharacterized protein n=1 Tax=Candidatus Magnetobacterium bavaricum TaxID=29290 RepID=A0A0F3GUY4_9BACT|nr:hypothetical protein MBAV_002100 [Candidatus Magnetobacterium bavaricum]
MQAVTATGLTVGTFVLPTTPGTNGYVLTSSGGGAPTWNAVGVPSLLNGKIFVGNASDVATGVTMSGDVTINNAGVTTLAASQSNITTASNLTTVGTLGSLNVTGTVTAGGFSGPLTGNVTGNVSGTAATVTGASQTNITTVGTLTGLTVSGATVLEGGTTINSGGNAYSLPTTAGSIGQVLTTGGTGTIATWSTVSGGTPSVTRENSDSTAGTTASKYCTGGKSVIGGGCICAGGGGSDAIVESYPSAAHTWTCTCISGNTTAYAICLQ